MTKNIIKSYWNFVKRVDKDLAKISTKTLNEIEYIDYAINKYGYRNMVDREGLESVGRSWRYIRNMLKRLQAGGYIHVKHVRRGRKEDVIIRFTRKGSIIARKLRAAHRKWLRS